MSAKESSSKGVEPFLKTKCLGGEYFEIRILMPDRPGALSAVTGLLACHGLSIDECRSFAKGEDVLDVFKIKTPVLPDWKVFEAQARRYMDLIRQGRMEQVRAELGERIVEYIRDQDASFGEKLHPIDLRIDNESSVDSTLIDIRSQDTPAFLYELSNALSLMGINIRRIEARTSKRTVRDKLWLTSEAGQKITSQDQLRAIQWSVLLIKQVTHVLPRVPDPAAALKQTVLFGKQIFSRKDFPQILLMLKKSNVLKAFSRAFGTSRYLWEEFIRLQSPSILRIMGDEKLMGERKTRREMARELKTALFERKSFGAKAEVLNGFKDRELFRIDLRHLLKKTSYVEESAEEFSDLAEVVVEAGREVAWAQAVRKHSRPKTVGRKASEDVILALGKFGGRELGYASDIELLFVYTDNPDSSSVQSRRNFDFYSEVVRNFCQVIQSRSEGVFHIDLRLRPYGKDGPLAASLDLFRDYYRPGGKAKNFERQALVKLRPVAGSRRLGREVEKIRDEFVYSGEHFDFKDALALRARQRKELVKRGTINAKYSAGGLLDVEYLVQTLQIVFGASHPEVRLPNTLAALDALHAGCLITDERYRAIRSAYLFLRDVINALRIVRGNAKDLTIHETHTREFTMLARRMGYSGSEELVGRIFHMECYNAMAMARKLYENTMAELSGSGVRTAEVSVVERPAFDGSSWGTVLKKDPAQACRLMEQAGFEDCPASLASLRRIETLLEGGSRRIFAGLIKKSSGFWENVGDPDLAVTHWEYFVQAWGKKRGLWDVLEKHPDRLGMLLRLFGSSRYLSEILIHNPGYWSWVGSGHEIKTAAVLKALNAASVKNADDAALLRMRHRETLRLGLCEMNDLASLEEVYGVFSRLADHVLQAHLGRFFKKNTLCVLGLGKLGGDELNFSSDLDLLFLSAGSCADSEDRARRFIQSVAGLGPESSFYRVDLRLRPYGDMGSLVLPAGDYLDYYRKGADAWEYQALLKARPVAGNMAAGRKLIRQLQPLVFRPRWDSSVVERWRVIKRRYESEVHRRDTNGTDIKLGAGGIRDIEFAIQFLQLMNGHRDEHLRQTNTLKALGQIEKLGLLAEADCAALREGYLFLRRVENRIHLFENRQEFTIPSQRRRLVALARSLGYAKKAGLGAGEEFLTDLSKVKSGCRRIFNRVFYDS